MAYAHSPGLAELWHSRLAVALVLRRTGRCHHSRVLPATDDHAWHADGLLRPHQRALRRVRKLLSAHSDRRGRYGVSPLQHDVILGNVRRFLRFGGSILRWRRSAAFGLDCLCPTKRDPWNRPRPSHGTNIVGSIDRDLLCWAAAWILKFHYDNPRPAHQGHDADAYATMHVG